MAYNKSKYVEAAQKLLNQGKVAQAIAEYQNILRHEPKDQVTLMTVGDLLVRQGETSAHRGKPVPHLGNAAARREVVTSEIERHRQGRQK